eukprot:TRINITY_DN16994_c0_g1_i1.p1 TRINITY_DN16994_c0_g1~~TRINITY_DN16994_c0_g1_i1.p1  ORF type:complete len:541 (-),score=30.38 TRINITY_DN16994_c0_g1_i1:1187-2809(-)
MAEKQEASLQEEALATLRKIDHENAQSGYLSPGKQVTFGPPESPGRPDATHQPQVDVPLNPPPLRPPSPGTATATTTTEVNRYRASSPPLSPRSKLAYDPHRSNEGFVLQPEGFYLKREYYTVDDADEQHAAARIRGLHHYELWWLHLWLLGDHVNLTQAAREWCEQFGHQLETQLGQWEIYKDLFTRILTHVIDRIGSTLHETRVTVSEKHETVERLTVRLQEVEEQMAAGAVAQELEARLRSELDAKTTAIMQLQQDKGLKTREINELRERLEASLRDQEEVMRRLSRYEAELSHKELELTAKSTQLADLQKALEGLVQVEVRRQNEHVVNEARVREAHQRSFRERVEVTQQVEHAARAFTDMRWMAELQRGMEGLRRQLALTEQAEVVRAAARTSPLRGATVCPAVIPVHLPPPPPGVNLTPQPPPPPVKHPPHPGIVEEEITTRMWASPHGPHGPPSPPITPPPINHPPPHHTPAAALPLPQPTPILASAGMTSPPRSASPKPIHMQPRSASPGPPLSPLPLSPLPHSRSFSPPLR